MARVNLVIKSDVATVSSEASDVALVHAFRERMSAWLSEFGHVAVTTGLDRTTFASIHDESTFSVTFPPGDFALKWVEVMLALQTIENIGRKIWAEIAPGVPAKVEVVCADVDGVVVNSLAKNAAAKHYARVSDVVPAPMRPLLALAVMLALLATGWLARPTMQQQQQASAVPPIVNLQICESTAALAPTAAAPRSERQQRRSRIYRSDGSVGN